MKQYASGVRLERTLIKQLQARPETVCAVRTAGSHGPFDVIWIRKEGVSLFQVKYGVFPSISEPELFLLSLMPCPTFIFWQPRRGRAMVFAPDQYEETKSRLSKDLRRKTSFPRKQQKSSREP